jgi:hypothetical protein
MQRCHCAASRYGRKLQPNEDLSFLPFSHAIPPRVVIHSRPGRTVPHGAPPYPLQGVRVGGATPAYPVRRVRHRGRRRWPSVRVHSSSTRVLWTSVSQQKIFFRERLAVLPFAVSREIREGTLARVPKCHDVLLRILDSRVGTLRPRIWLPSRFRQESIGSASPLDFSHRWTFPFYGTSGSRPRSRAVTEDWTRSRSQGACHGNTEKPLQTSTGARACAKHRKAERTNLSVPGLLLHGATIRANALADRSDRPPDRLRLG